MRGFGKTILGYDVIVLAPGYIDWGWFSVTKSRGFFQLRIRHFVFHIRKNIWATKL